MNKIILTIEFTKQLSDTRKERIVENLEEFIDAQGDLVWVGSGMNFLTNERDIHIKILD